MFKFYKKPFKSLFIISTMASSITEEFIQHVLSPAELERYNKRSADNKLTGSNVEDEQL